MTRNRSATGDGLNDAALDRLLAPGADPGQRASDETLADLVIATRVEVLQGTQTAVRPRKKRWVVPWVVGGAVVLAGAGTTAAYQLSVPPFQTIEQGVERTSVGIPVDYVNYRNRQVRCEAFIDFTEVTDRQRQEINTLASSTDWTGYGQGLVESLPASQRVTLDQEAQALSRGVDADLTARTLRAVSGVAAPNPAAKGPRLTGSSMSCTEPGGQDGAP